MTARIPSRGADPRIELLLEVLDQAFDRKGWHGTTLRGSLRGVTPDEALWRPARGRHNIWELTVHAAYWKYAVRRRLAGDAVGLLCPKAQQLAARCRLPLMHGHGSGTSACWRAEHRLLREAVRALPPAKLEGRSPQGVWTNAEEIHGIAAHDLYHTGQIQLIKKLMR